MTFEAASSERSMRESNKLHFLLDSISGRQLGTIKLPQEDTLRHLHTMHYYSAIKRSKLLTPPKPWMNLKYIMLCETSQTQGCLSDSTCRQTSFYCASQMLHFLQIEGPWQLCIKQVYRHQFSNSLCSLCVSVSHFGNSRSISNLFIIIVFGGL